MIAAWQLNQLQSISLRGQIDRSKRKIAEWYYRHNGDIYVSVSGRDSCVMLDMVRDLFPSVLAVYCNTGLEHPEVREHVKTLDNVEWIKPKINFKQVIETHGFPVVSKEVSQKIREVRTTKSEKLRRYRLEGANNKYKSGKIPECWKYLIDAPFKISDKCCEIMKKRPFKVFERQSGLVPMLGTMAADSLLRRQSFMKYTCNAFAMKRQTSRPMSTWTGNHILQYVQERQLPIAKCYDWVESTGCLWCMFGLQFEDEPNRFQQMAVHQPKLWRYVIYDLGLGEVLEYMGYPYKPVMQQQDMFRAVPTL